MGDDVEVWNQGLKLTLLLALRAQRPLCFVQLLAWMLLSLDTCFHSTGFIGNNISGLSFHLNIPGQVFFCDLEHYLVLVPIPSIKTAWTMLKYALALRHRSTGINRQSVSQLNTLHTITPPPLTCRAVTIHDGSIASCSLRITASLPSLWRSWHEDLSDQTTFFHSSTV